MVIPLVVASTTPLVKAESGFESKSSQCREFAAEGIGMICVALHFVIDVFGANRGCKHLGANDTPT